MNSTQTENVKPPIDHAAAQAAFDTLQKKLAVWRAKEALRSLGVKQ